MIYKYLLIVFLCGVSTSLAKLDLKKWKSDNFTEYAGHYELYKTEGKISRLLLTPYETKQGHEYISVLKINSEDIGYQPVYHIMGDMVVSEKGEMNFHSGVKCQAYYFFCPILKKKIYAIKIDGVLYKRVNSLK